MEHNLPGSYELAFKNSRSGSKTELDRQTDILKPNNGQLIFQHLCFRMAMLMALGPLISWTAQDLLTCVTCGTFRLFREYNVMCNKTNWEVNKFGA